MGRKFNLDGNILYDTQTGSAVIYEDKEKIEHYAILARAGHCGKGYYIPQLLPITASNPELAIEIARKRGKIKSSRSGAIIDVMKVSELEKNFILYINDCDKYIHISHHTKEICDSIMERRIAMEEAVDFRNSGNRNRIQACTVKTADKYSNVHVLQRYLAPSYYGDKLIYPKSINFRDMLDEFFYYSTLQMGLFRKKPAPLSFYYQLYGDKNNLGIKYNNGFLFFKDGTQTVRIEAPEKSIPYLEASKKRFEQERLAEEAEKQKQLEEDARISKNQKSATQKFNERFAKYQKIKNSKLPEK